MKKFLIFILYVSIFTLFIFLSPKVVLARVLFQDNFDDGTANNWVLTRSMQWQNKSQPCLYNGQPAKWIVKNQKLGIKIMGPGCVTEITPNDHVWNPSWNDYIFEVDMTFVKGTDKNLAWRYSDPNHWYDLHFFGSYVMLQRFPGAPTAYGPFPNGNTYHIKIIVNGFHFKIYIDGIKKFDGIDTNKSFPTGRIALQASVGGDPNSEVYFDNIVVRTLDEEEKKPIILLPGHGASWCTSAMISGSECKTSWKMNPIAEKIYGNLIATLEKAGYEKDKNLFIYNYDWRKKIDETADDFKNFINNKISSGKQAILIGHSMGGLIARDYLQKNSSPPIEKLITIGSPHKGVPFAYYSWEGGEIPNDNTWQWLALQILLQINKKKFETNMETIHHFAPSTKDLLPVFNYLTKNSQEVDVNSMEQQNNWLKSLNVNLNSPTASLLTTIAGINKNTLSQIKVKERTWLDKILETWPDGKPIEKVNSNEGDGTVLLKSATINDIPIEKLELNHSALISKENGLAKIMELLNISVSPQILASAPPRNPSLILFLHSPAQLTLKNPPANMIFSQPDNLIIVPEAQSGQYEVQIIGTGNGIYHLEIGQLTQNGDFWQTVNGTIKAGENKNLTIDFNPDTPKENPIIDESGSISLAIIRTKIEELKTYVANLSIRRSIKNRIIYNLNRMLKQLKRENYHSIQRTLVYLYRLMFSLDRWQKYHLISEDKDIYIKNSLLEIANYLEDAYVIIRGRSGRPANPARINRSLKIVNKILSQLKPKIKIKKAALIYRLITEKYNKAQEEFNSQNYFSSEISAFSARFLSFEAKYLSR